MEKRDNSRVRLTQEEAEKRLAAFLKDTPYALRSRLVFNTVRNTNVELHCTIHDFDWIVSYKGRQNLFKVAYVHKIKCQFLIIASWLRFVTESVEL